MSDQRTQKSLYATDEIADWIKDSAEESGKISESKFLLHIVHQVADDVDGEPVNINLYDIKAEHKFKDKIDPK